MRLYLRFLLVLLFSFLSFEAVAGADLKDINHNDISLTMRVPNSWHVTKSKKSIRYSMNGNGKMNIRHWENKNALKVVNKLRSSFKEKGAQVFDNTEYTLSDYRVFSFDSILEVKKEKLKQNINIIDTKNGIYFIQFLTKINNHNPIEYNKILATFRVLETSK